MFKIDFCAKCMLVLVEKQKNVSMNIVLLTLFLEIGTQNASETRHSDVIVFKNEI